MTREPRIGVVGGGVAGLTAGYRLALRGAAVTVWESSSRLGGRAATDRYEGYRIDVGAQLAGSMYTRLLALAREVGLEGSLARSPGRDALWRDGRPHEVVYGSVTSMLASGGLPLRAKMRLGTTYLPFLTRHAEVLDVAALERAAAAGLDGESIGAWGERVLGREFVDYLAHPQLASYYGATAEETSAALYHMMARHGVDVTLYALRGGVGSLSERLAERIGEEGGEVRAGAAVEWLEPRGGGVAVGGAGWSAELDGVILAAQAPVTRGLVSGFAPPLGAWLERVRYAPGVTVALLLDRPLGVRYFGLSFARGEGSVVSAVCVEENKVEGLVPEGAGLLLAIVAPAAAPRLVDAEASQVVDSVLATLATVYPGLEASLARARVYRWPVGTPLFYPGYLRALGEYRDSEPEGGHPIALAGDFLYGPSMEGAVLSGEAAVERLLSRLPSRSAS